MIILRKLRPQQGSNATCVILADSLIGTADGVNQVFEVSYEYTPGRIEIIYDGQVLTSPDDFEETGPQEITFVYLKPTAQTILKANYETPECGASTDTFIDLTDTPSTYSGYEGYYVKVNSTGDGLEFVLPGGDTQEGITNISSGVSSTAVTFSHSFPSDEYVLTVSLENKVDVTPSVYPTLIRNKTTSGFEVDFSGEIDSGNYYLNWRATYSGSASSSSSGGSGITELSEDLTPELGGDLVVDGHLLIYDTTPSNTTISGGYVRGYSGEASYMNIFDNSPPAGDGFGTPLYLRSDGKWGTCTAVSGSTQMPCAALAIDTGEGANKKILWKGTVRKGEWSWTPGSTIYVSTVEGALTSAEPNNGHRKQVIGIAIASDTIRFDPDLRVY